MGILGNILWSIVGGGIISMGYLTGGILLCLTII
ncbi:MAG: YccF domain-containing protein [Candidatus Aminicenantia bacterium]